MFFTKRKFYIIIGLAVLLLCSLYLYFSVYVHRSVDFDKRFFNNTNYYETSKIIIYKAERELELYADSDLIDLYKNENPPVDIEKVVSAHSDAIIEGARLDVANKSRYKDAYYQGGYPPEDEGVCTDLVWRAFKNAGIDLKSLIDSDIKTNVNKYPRITGGPDPNIDFRRVKNHIVFFGRHGITLTNEVDVNDIENLKQWQGGDIVTIESPEHMGIISDKRNPKGVPYVIHNMGPVPREDDCLENWNGKITGHFRYPAE